MIDSLHIGCQKIVVILLLWLCLCISIKIWGCKFNLMHIASSSIFVHNCFECDSLDDERDIFNTFIFCWNVSVLVLRANCLLVFLTYSPPSLKNRESPLSKYMCRSLHGSGSLRREVLFFLMNCSVYFLPVLIINAKEAVLLGLPLFA